MLVSSPLSTLAPAVVFSPDEAKSGMPSAVAVDFDALMQAHLTRVFNERDSDRRLSALADLYMEDATLFEPHAAAAWPASWYAAASSCSTPT